MKNKFLSVISLLFALILLAGCGKSVKVTKENVKELFTPTLEADVYMYGSAFYSVEKDEKGYPELYKVTDDFSGYKITEKTAVDEIFEKVAKYEKRNFELTESEKEAFLEKDGTLYVDMIGVYGGFEAIYDLNSIRLEKTDGDNYYISVDVYAYPDLAAQINPKKSDTPDFYAKETYTVKEVDGVLQIQDSGIEKNSDPINDPTNCEFIGGFDKFWGDVISRDGAVG